MVRADRGGALQLAPLRGMRGDAIRRRYPDHAAMSSALWVNGDGPPLSASDAILAVADYLGGGWGALGRVGRLIPHGVRDWMYYTFARNRNFFGWLGLSALDDSARRRLLSDDEWKPGTHDSA